MALNVEFIIRLIVAGILGAVIGLDREYRAKEAGYRTHFLVSLGSALMMIVSQYGFAGVLQEGVVRLDPSRIAAQVVTGIGFIGAGTIIFQKQVVRGLTTAAGIWTAAGIGLAIGAGMYIIGIVATLLTLAGLELLNRIFKNIGMKSIGITFLTENKNILKDLAKHCKNYDFRIVSFQMEIISHPGNPAYQVTAVIKSRKANDESTLLSMIEDFPEVTIERIE